MCGRHGDGSATRPANTIDHNLSALACAARMPACFPLFPGSVCKRAKAQFMKSFIWSRWRLPEEEGGLHSCSRGNTGEI